MGENKDEPVEHIWISGRLNMTKDPNSDLVTYAWQNPITGKRIPDSKSEGEALFASFHADHRTLDPGTPCRHHKIATRPERMVTSDTSPYQDITLQPEVAVEHIWISGRLNMTKDPNSDLVTYAWQNPITGKRIPDSKSEGEALFASFHADHRTLDPGTPCRHHKIATRPERMVTSDTSPYQDITLQPEVGSSTYMLPWLDEEFSMDNPCLNLDRQDHLNGLVYGMSCDTPQYSICMIEKNPPKTGSKENMIEGNYST
ncbi:hypothetical protein RR48_03184 [Papilio machaon]|uniref:Uncharacterized protein n=1 Tax=Papilio machaon TaxID=76193 RepID=A0A0N1IAQ7_PAPMA|nr:hypothetical protein RR48_03184 [Papilio machaon]